MYMNNMNLHGQHRVHIGYIRVRGRYCTIQHWERYAYLGWSLCRLRAPNSCHPESGTSLHVSKPHIIPTLPDVPRRRWPLMLGWTTKNKRRTAHSENAGLPSKSSRINADYGQILDSTTLPPEPRPPHIFEDAGCDDKVTQSTCDSDW